MYTQRLISDIAEEGEKRGLEKGLRFVLRVLEERVHRSLTVQENRQVKSHLMEMDGDKLFDVVGTLDDTALETWLQTPSRDRNKITDRSQLAQQCPLLATCHTDFA